MNFMKKTTLDAHYTKRPVYCLSNQSGLLARKSLFVTKFFEGQYQPWYCIGRVDINCPRTKNNNFPSSSSSSLPNTVQWEIPNDPMGKTK